MHGMATNLPYADMIGLDRLMWVGNNRCQICENCPMFFLIMKKTLLMFLVLYYILPDIQLLLWMTRAGNLEKHGIHNLIHIILRMQYKQTKAELFSLIEEEFDSFHKRVISLFEWNLFVCFVFRCFKGIKQCKNCTLLLHPKSGFAGRPFPHIYFSVSVFHLLHWKPE